MPGQQMGFVAGGTIVIILIVCLSWLEMTSVVGQSSSIGAGQERTLQTATQGEHGGRLFNVIASHPADSVTQRSMEASSSGKGGGLASAVFRCT